MIAQSGEIKNLFSESEMDHLVECLSQLDFIKIGNNICKGVNEDHIMYQWFYQNCFSKVKAYIGEDAQLVFGMYLEENTMWGIHTDIYHCDPYPDKIPYISMIIPYSVDRKKELVDCSNTIVFNESSYDFAPTNDNKNWAPALLTRPTPADSANQYFESYLSHNKPEIVNKLTLRQIYKWSLGSLIYWESSLLHDSDNFKKNGHISKEAIVIHTYKSANNC
jgi:hypothetical protein